MQPQPQHRSVHGCGLLRICDGWFCRCGRVGLGSSEHAVPRIANQPVTWSDITDFENANVDKLFHEKTEDMMF